MSRLRTGDEVVAEPPEALMDLRSLAAPGTSHDVLPDGSVVVIQPAPWEPEDRSIEIVVHWDGRPRRRGDWTGGR